MIVMLTSTGKYINDNYKIGLPKHLQRHQKRFNNLTKNDILSTEKCKYIILEK